MNIKSSVTLDEKKTIVTTFADLILALDSGFKIILVKRSFVCNYSFILPQMVSIKGIKQENGELPMLSFIDSNGIGITRENTICDLNIDCPINNKAIYNTVNNGDLGTFKFENLLIKGQISVITRAKVDKTNIIIDNVDIISSDSRHYLEQPQKYGVNVLQGALTIYNLNPDEKSIINVQIDNLNIGRKNAPVTGSGVFIAGCGDEGGKVIVTKIQVDSIYSNGKIPPGVSDYITAGLFILNGTYANEVITNGEIITYGINDMVLDVWGEVKKWISNGSVISYGPSGVGFVNFGIVENFIVKAPLQTFGLGARGYNQYDGTVNDIRFKSIETFGDGSVGIQISKKIGDLTIEEDVITRGSLGSSLVKGKYVDLPAYGLSIKDGGSVNSITIKGCLETFGNNVISYIQENGGDVKNITINGGVKANGENSKPKLIE